MGNKLPIHRVVPQLRERCSGCFRLLAVLVRKPVFAYITISIILAFSVGAYDHHQRDQIVAGEHKAHSELALHQYKECLNLESVKAQANHRIVLLREAQHGIVFKNARVEAQVEATLHAVKPLAKVDCKPLRPGK